MRFATTSTIIFTVILLAGCSSEYAPRLSNKASISMESTEAFSGSESDTDGLMTAGMLGRATDASGAIIADRKIIYDTKIGLVVEDYASFENKLPTLVSLRGGFVASNKTDRRYNNNQSGIWVVRLPVAQYAEFLTSVSALGFAESRTEKAQDVTEEYVDVTARIKNKKKLEVRVLEMLDKRNGPLKDVLEIERELSRVREEIERMEGRLRFLQDRTSLATVTICCREQKEYQPTEAPTLASRINQSWSNSIGGLQRAGANFLVGLVGSIPWVVLFGVVLGLAALFTRRYWRMLSRISPQTN